MEYGQYTLKKDVCIEKHIANEVIFFGGIYTTGFEFLTDTSGFEFLAPRIYSATQIEGQFSALRHHSAIDRNLRNFTRRQSLRNSRLLINAS
jgi:hypothetical protein